MESTTKITDPNANNRTVGQILQNNNSIVISLLLDFEHSFLPIQGFGKEVNISKTLIDFYRAQVKLLQTSQEDKDTFLARFKSEYDKALQGRFFKRSETDYETTFHNIFIAFAEVIIDLKDYTSDSLEKYNVESRSEKLRTVLSTASTVRADLIKKIVFIEDTVKSAMDGVSQEISSSFKKLSSNIEKQYHDLLILAKAIQDAIGTIKIIIEAKNQENQEKRVKFIARITQELSSEDISLERTKALQEEVTQFEKDMREATSIFLSQEIAPQLGLLQTDIARFQRGASISQTKADSPFESTFYHRQVEAHLEECRNIQSSTKRTILSETSKLPNIQETLLEQLQLITTELGNLQISDKSTAGLLLQRLPKLENIAESLIDLQNNFSGEKFPQPAMASFFNNLSETVLNIKNNIAELRIRFEGNLQSEATPTTALSRYLEDLGAETKSYQTKNSQFLEGLDGMALTKVDLKQQRQQLCNLMLSIEQQVKEITTQMSPMTEVSLEVEETGSKKAKTKLKLTDKVESHVKAIESTIMQIKEKQQSLLKDIINIDTLILLCEIELKNELFSNDDSLQILGGELKKFAESLANIRSEINKDSTTLDQVSQVSLTNKLHSLETIPNELVKLKSQVSTFNDKLVAKRESLSTEKVKKDEAERKREEERRKQQENENLKKQKIAIKEIKVLVAKIKKELEGYSPSNKNYQDNDVLVLLHAMHNNLLEETENSFKKLLKEGTNLEALENIKTGLTNQTNSINEFKEKIESYLVTSKTTINQETGSPVPLTRDKPIMDTHETVPAEDQDSLYADSDIILISSNKDTDEDEVENRSKQQIDESSKGTHRDSSDNTEQQVNREEMQLIPARIPVVTIFDQIFQLHTLFSEYTTATLNQTEDINTRRERLGIINKRVGTTLETINSESINNFFKNMFTFIEAKSELQLIQEELNICKKTEPKNLSAITEKRDTQLLKTRKAFKTVVDSLAITKNTNSKDMYLFLHAYFLMQEAEFINGRVQHRNNLFEIPSIVTLMNLERDTRLPIDIKIPAALKLIIDDKVKDIRVSVIKALIEEIQTRKPEISKQLDVIKGDLLTIQTNLQVAFGQRSQNQLPTTLHATLNDILQDVIEVDKKSADELYRINLLTIKNDILNHKFILHGGFGSTIPDKKNGKSSKAAKQVYDQIVVRLNDNNPISKDEYEVLATSVKKAVHNKKTSRTFFGFYTLGGRDASTTDLYTRIERNLDNKTIQPDSEQRLHHQAST